jgi:hypothetical protein
MTMPASRNETASSWFRGRGGKRFAREFALVILMKIILLGTLWAVVVRPQPRADTSPAAIEQHFSVPEKQEPGQ